MNDLQEQVKVEHAPTDKNEHGVEVSHNAKVEQLVSKGCVTEITKI